MGKHVALLKDYVSQGTTIPKGNVGELVSRSGRNDSPMASEPDIENGVVKIRFTNPKTIVIGIAVDALKSWVADVPVGTVLTT